MKWSVVLLILFDFSAACTDISLIDDTNCRDLENAELKIGGTDVIYGEKYPLAEVSESSVQVTFAGAKKGALYLIAMVDPDAPSHDNAVCRSWLHYINKNVQGTQLASGEHGGEIVTKYNPPTPPSGSGYHHYYIFVFEQEEVVEYVRSPSSSRCKFDIDDFTTSQHLKPVAMNMFQTQRP